VNLKQLERLREMLHEAWETLETDPVGSAAVKSALGDLEVQVNQELKEKVWQRYLEAEG